MAIVSAKYQFIIINAGVNGRVSHGGVMKNTFWTKLSENQLNLPISENCLPLRSSARMCL
nr:unnamed protein product [Callosobruchus analis]